MSTALASTLSHSLSSSVDKSVERGGIGKFRLLGGFGRGVNFTLDCSFYLRACRFVERSNPAQALFEDRHRIVRFPGLHLIGRSVRAVVIVGGVGVEAVDLCFNQSWSTALTGAVDCFFDCLIDRKQI